MSRHGRHEGLDVFFAERPSRSSKELYFSKRRLPFGWIVPGNDCCSICLQSVGLFCAKCQDVLFLVELIDAMWLAIC